MALDASESAIGNLSQCALANSLSVEAIRADLRDYRIAELMRFISFRTRLVFDYLRMTKNSSPNAA